jgi:hypothetical protein
MVSLRIFRIKSWAPVIAVWLCVQIYAKAPVPHRKEYRCATRIGYSFCKHEKIAKCF